MGKILHSGYLSLKNMKFNNKVRFFISIHAKTNNTTRTEQKSTSSSGIISILVLIFGKMYL